MTCSHSLELVIRVVRLGELVIHNLQTVFIKEMTELFSEWATTRQLEPIIGIREKTLYRLRQSGVLELGKHYRLKNPLNPKSHILYHVQNVINELTRTDLEKKLIETDKLSAKKKTLKKNTVKA